MKISRMATSLVIGAVALSVLAGCNRSMSRIETRAPPQPLPSVPLEPVQTTQLDPAASGGQPLDPSAGYGDQNGNPYGVASNDPYAAQTLEPQDQVSAMATPPAETTGSAGAEPVSREEMAGTWTVSSDNPDCRIILAFTKWSGGYRAATRRCSSPELGAVTAWDVKGSSVVLVDSNGATIASLYSSGPERYDGSLAGGSAISFTR